MPSIDHGTITFYITTKRDNMSTTDTPPLTMPADLVAAFRTEARFALRHREGDDARGQAVAYLHCADWLETALKNQAGAKAEAVAYLKKVGTGKPSAPPKRKR